MRTPTRLIVAGFILIMAVAGCKTEKPGTTEQPDTGSTNQSGVKAGGVAILDLDAVAKRFGCDRQMSTSIQQREASLNQQLASIKSDYAKQFADRRQEFGDTPTDEQAKLLADIQRQASASLNEVRQRAKNNLSQHGSLLIQGFRKEIKPIARQVARERGLAIIVTKNDSVVFDYDTTVDITGGVIEKLLALQSKQAPAQGPATRAPADQGSSDPPATADRPARTIR